MQNKSKHHIVNPAHFTGLPPEEMESQSSHNCASDSVSERSRSPLSSTEATTVALANVATNASTNASTSALANATTSAPTRAPVRAPARLPKELLQRAHPRTPQRTLPSVPPPVPPKVPPKVPPRVPSLESSSDAEQQADAALRQGLTRCQSRAASTVEHATASHGSKHDHDEEKATYLPLSRTTDRVLKILLEGDLARLRAESVAESLGISCTTLRRRLRNDHTSYQFLLDRARQYRCESRLRERWLPGKCFADELGYLEVNSFYRAFRRWTGISYSEYKESYY